MYQSVRTLPILPYKLPVSEYKPMIGDLTDCTTKDTLSISMLIHISEIDDIQIRNSVLLPTSASKMKHLSNLQFFLKSLF